VAGRGTLVTARHLGIVELHTVCHDLRRWNEGLFETLGRWVVTTDDPALQQLLAEACHLHAWHAELWAGRSPTIPIDEPEIASRRTLDDADRPGSYRAELAEMRAALDAVAARVDRRLDPSTSRVVDLVSADLTMLAARAAGLG
jgi:hypothetical protein